MTTSRATSRPPPPTDALHGLERQFSDLRVGVLETTGGEQAAEHVRRQRQQVGPLAVLEDGRQTAERAQQRREARLRRLRRLRHGRGDRVRWWGRDDVSEETRE